MDETDINTANEKSKLKDIDHDADTMNKPNAMNPDEVCIDYCLLFYACKNQAYYRRALQASSMFMHVSHIMLTLL